MSITIGIPFYNSERFLADAIRSIFAQTYQDWELLLVDDGSTDRSLEIARSVQDSRVRVISDGRNMKLPARLNQIVQEARYDLIGRMDADDLISPTRFARQTNVLLEHPEIDLVTSGVFSVTDDLLPVGFRWHYSTRINLDDLFARKGCGIVHAAVLGRKAWFARNPYDTTVKLSQDYELWLRTALNGDLKIYLMQEPLYFYREESSATAEKLLRSYHNLYRMYWKHGGYRSPLLITKTWCKSVIVRLLSAAGRMDILLKRRSTAIHDPAMLSLFYREIEDIRRTRVPGLD
jgi:glycosyltransferase involved in cell wall biosynthesis